MSSVVRCWLSLSLCVVRRSVCAVCGLLFGALFADGYVLSAVVRC